MLVRERPAPAALAVEEVTETGALERLRPEWEALWRACPTATPFQSPAWLLPWWEHVGEGRLWTLGVRRGGRLVGLAPLYVYTQPDTGSRDLFLLGMATTDYLDLLYAPGTGREVAEAVLAHLDARRDRWDVCDLSQLRPGSPLLEARAPAGWSDDRWPDEPCPTLPLPRTVEELQARLPSGLRRKLRYYGRRAERLGCMEVERADAATWREHYDALLRLHEARWRQKGEEGVLAPPPVQAAHWDSIPAMLACGALRMYALRLDGRIIGSFYGFADPPRARGERRFYCYIGGFDPDYAEVAPGSVLIGHALEAAVREGCAVFDFLRGQEPYKYVWGAQDGATWRRQLQVDG